MYFKYIRKPGGRDMNNKLLSKMNFAELLEHIKELQHPCGEYDKAMTCLRKKVSNADGWEAYASVAKKTEDIGFAAKKVAAKIVGSRAYQRRIIVLHEMSAFNKKSILVRAVYDLLKEMEISENIALIHLRFALEFEDEEGVNIFLGRIDIEGLDSEDANTLFSRELGISSIKGDFAREVLSDILENISMTDWWIGDITFFLNEYRRSFDLENFPSFHQTLVD